MFSKLLGGRRRPAGHGKELASYRDQLTARTTRVDAILAHVAEIIDALRRRDADIDASLEALDAAEAELDVLAEELREILAPEALHGLHADYEANLERALRGIVTVERGCGITRMRHRPPEDEEPFTYYKRGYLNVVHARMRMAELVEVLATWEPGKPAEASVSTRLHREEL
jgi:hypothetical protein